MAALLAGSRRDAMILVEDGPVWRGRRTAERGKPRCAPLAHRVTSTLQEALSQAVAELRQRALREQAARVAAEQETKSAQEELARERKSKQEAWNVVAQLKKRLTIAQGNPAKAKATPTRATQATNPSQRDPKSLNKERDDFRRLGYFCWTTVPALGVNRCIGAIFGAAARLRGMAKPSASDLGSKRTARAASLG